MPQIIIIVPLTGSYLVAVRFLMAVMVLACMYGFSNPKWRNTISGDLYRLRGMKRTGAPASLRTHCLSFLFWSYGLFLSFQPADWADSSFWKIAPFLAFMTGGMVSSYVDVKFH